MIGRCGRWTLPALLILATVAAVVLSGAGYGVSGASATHVPDGVITFAEAAGASTVTTDVAVAWAILPRNASPVRAAQRLGMVRGFARYLQAADPAAQVPPAGLLPARTRRVTPYIYSDTEVAALMTAARMLRNRLKAATFETLIGLLAVTGLRGSEAMALDERRSARAPRSAAVCGTVSTSSGFISGL